MDWYLDLLGDASDRPAAYAELEASARDVPVAAAGVRFLPFLGGRARSGASGSFTGLTLEHGRAALGRAVLEGASCAVRAVFDQVRVAGGAVDRLRATGGGAESRLWLEILANLLHEPIEITGRAVEARGAAMCLAVALGIHPDLGAATAAMVSVQESIEPEAMEADVYEDLYLEWTALCELNRRASS